MEGLHQLIVGFDGGDIVVFAVYLAFVIIEIFAAFTFAGGAGEKAAAMAMEDAAQGHFFGAPVSAEEMTRGLREEALSRRSLPKLTVVAG